MHERIHGMLHISPAVGRRHQKVTLQLAKRLDDACPSDLDVLTAPFPVFEGDETGVLPDVVVARNADFADEFLAAEPLLAVEVLSPSSALFDLGSKKALYEQMGTPSYWVIDPVELALTVFELDETGRYQLVAEVRDGKAFDAVRPFPVQVVPGELLG